MDGSLEHKRNRIPIEVANKCAVKALQFKVDWSSEKDQHVKDRQREAMKEEFQSRVICLPVDIVPH